MSDIIYDTAIAAEKAFYCALEAGDFTAMMTVWEPVSTVVCIHPLGLCLLGINQVRASWQAILRNNTRLEVVCEPIQRLDEPAIAIHSVYEHITLAYAAKLEPGVATQQTMLATNIYRFNTLGWRMILHHSSPPPSVPAKTRTKFQIH